MNSSVSQGPLSWSSFSCCRWLPRSLGDFMKGQEHSEEMAWPGFSGAFLISDAWQPAAQLGKWALFKCDSEGEASIHSFCRGCLVTCLGMLPSDARGWALEKPFSQSGAGRKLLAWGRGRARRRDRGSTVPVRQPGSSYEPNSFHSQLLL